MVDEAPAVAFEAHLDAKPVLNFRDFTGVIEMKAAVSPDCSYQLVQGALAQAGDGSKSMFTSTASRRPHLMELLKDAVDRGAKYSRDVRSRADALRRMCRRSEASGST